MRTRIKNNHQTNRLIQLFIIAGDFAVLWVLLYYLVGTIPQSEGWDEEKGRAFWMVCTFAFVVAEYLFPSVIHERVVGANDILRRSTMLVATHTLLSYLLLRAIHFVSRLGWQLFAMGLVMLVSIILLRFVERWLVKKLRQSGYNTRSVTLVGEDEELLRLYYKLQGNRFPWRDPRTLADGGSCGTRHLVHAALESLARHPHYLDDGQDNLC